MLFVSTYSFTGFDQGFIYLRFIDAGYLGNRRSSSLVYCRQTAKQMRLERGFRQILDLGIHNATIYREIDRGSINGIYDPDHAEEQYRGHLSEKGRPPICSISPELAQHIARLIIEEKLSPARIIDTSIPLSESSRVRPGSVLLS